MQSLGEQFVVHWTVSVTIGPRKCFLCETVGIMTVADSPKPITAGEKSYAVCQGCYVTHHRAIDRGVRTMLDRMLNMNAIKARANATPRKKPV